MIIKTIDIIALKGDNKIYCDDCSKDADSQDDLTPVLECDIADDETVTCDQCGKIIYP